MNLMDNCERCGRGKPVALVTSEILTLRVCTYCALEAMEWLGPSPDELKILGVGKVANDGRN